MSLLVSSALQLHLKQPEPFNPFARSTQLPDYHPLFIATLELRTASCIMQAKIEEGSIVVKTKEGDKTVMVMPSTKSVKGTAAATQKDLKVGDRVAIHAAPMGGSQC